MKTINQIPEELFNWLEASDFYSLNNEQQSQVREFFSEQEYTIMHRATSKLRLVARSARPKGKDQIKNELLQAFDKKHGKQNTFIILLNQPIRLGVAAAITLFLLTALIWQNFSINRHVDVVEIPVRIDTVQVESKTAPYVVHDTVLIPFQATSREHQLSARPPVPVRINDQELLISGADDLSAPINQTKNTSFQADSLVQKFGFVTM